MEDRIQNKIKEENELKEKDGIKKLSKKYKLLDITLSNKTDIRINECLIKDSPYINLDSYARNVSKSVCKIKIEMGNIFRYGSGFLLRIAINQEKFYCLMSNEHIITTDNIKNKNDIYIFYDNEHKLINIKLDTNKRYIKSFISNNLDITVVEILDIDNISKEYFLMYENETLINFKLINSIIYTAQFPKGKEFKSAKGKIIKINNNEFTHLASTDTGSSGSPIFLEKSIKVIGIHKQSHKYKKENYADFIYPAISLIKMDIIEIRNKGKYIKGKYIWEDGKYYLGEFKNNKPNGKGIKYYKNGKIMYEGSFINGKYDGIGKYIYKEGHYFIGKYENGLRNGKVLNIIKMEILDMKEVILMVKKMEMES